VIKFTKGLLFHLIREPWVLWLKHGQYKPVGAVHQKVQPEGDRATLISLPNPAIVPQLFDLVFHLI